MANRKPPAAPTGISQAELRRRTLDVMEADLRISDKAAKDFVNSLVAVVKEATSEGRKVSVFGIVNLIPAFKLAKPKRKGIDPRTREETTFKAQPAKVKIRATVGKGIKDMLPKATTAAGKSLAAVSEYKAKEAEKRAKARAKEEGA